MSFATSQFSHCYLYCGMRKKNVGHYFLSNPRNTPRSLNVMKYVFCFAQDLMLHWMVLTQCV